MELGFILNNKSLVRVVNGLGELGRDGVVGSLVLENKTLVALDGAEDSGLLDRPGADVGPFLLGALLLGVRRLPSRVPVVGELLEEGSLERRGLGRGVTGLEDSGPSEGLVSTYSKGGLGDCRRSHRLDDRRHRGRGLGGSVFKVVEDIGPGDGGTEAQS